MKEEIKGNNLFETYEVNGRLYTDNLGNALISIPKKQYIEYTQLKEQLEDKDKAIEEIDDILYYWCELCEVEWVELKIEDFTNIFKKLKSILEGEAKQ